MVSILENKNTQYEDTKEDLKKPKTAVFITSYLVCKV
jgi:hypothetical protein